MSLLQLLTENICGFMHWLDETGIFVVFTDESVICMDVGVTVSCALDLCIEKPIEMSNHVEDHIWHCSIWSILTSVYDGKRLHFQGLMCCHVTWRYTLLEIQHKLNTNNPIKWGWDKIVQLNIPYVNNAQYNMLLFCFLFCGLWVSVMLQVAKGKLSASHVT